MDGFMEWHGSTFSTFSTFQGAEKHREFLVVLNQEMVAMDNLSQAPGPTSFWFHSGRCHRPSWQPDDHDIGHWAFPNLSTQNPVGSVSKPCTPGEIIKIAGKWMFIPLKMVSVGMDPYPVSSHPQTLVGREC